MTSADLLPTIAELSVALAGFSGVVVGLRAGRGGDPPRQNLFGLLHILASSGAAMVFSLLPATLHAAGLDERIAWTTTSALLGTTVVVAAVLWAFATRATKPRFPWVYWSFIASGIVLGLMLLVSTTGWRAHEGSLLPLVLLWLLLVGFAQFATFLVLSSGDSGK